ncbi:MAG: hypothetical protein Kow006_10090 [Gammaproteobacteria bacterium]
MKSASARPLQETSSTLLKALGVEPYLEFRYTETVGTLPIHCEVFEHDPQAPLLIFLPGISTYAALYAALLFHLQREGFNVVGVDLRGHGHSGGERGAYRVEEVIGDVGHVIDHFTTRFAGPVLLFGYSIGAPLALATAERDERVEALLCHTLLVSEHAPDLLHLWGWHWLQHASFFFPHLHLPLQRLFHLQDLIPERRFRRLVAEDPLLVTHYPIATLASVLNRRSRIMREQCHFRAGIVTGEEDELVPLDYLERVVEKAVHPLDLTVIPGGNHMIPFWEPERLAKIAADWFRDSADSTHPAVTSATG